jgi:outer membrane protein assembly factor BamB
MMMRLLLALIVFGCLSMTVFAQNWPSFRGSNASGVADGQPLPTSWDAERAVNILWKTPIPGLAYSSPVIWGNRVFITTAVSEDPSSQYDHHTGGNIEPRDKVKHSWRIYCLEKSSGQVIWQRTAHEGIPRVNRHIKASQANQTPVTDGRYVVALMGSEGIFAFDLGGKLLWKRDLGLLNPGLYGDQTSEWGHAASPIIYKNLVIVQCDAHRQSFIAAYSLQTGEEVWRTERHEITSWSTPGVYEGVKRPELIVNGGHYIRGYDPLTGKELWRFSDSDTQVKQQVPVIAQGLIILAGGYPPGRPIYAFRPGASGDISLKEGEETNRFLAWRIPKGSAYTPTPLAYGDHLYICDDKGVMSAWRIATGELVYQERVPGSFTASPVAGDGKLYLAGEDGELFVVKAGAKFEILATNPMGESLMATPAISDGMLIVRGRHQVFAIAEKPRGRRNSNASRKPARVALENAAPKR